MRWSKRYLMVLICMAFVLAPLQRASATMHLQANLVSGQSDYVNKQEAAHLHGGDIRTYPNTEDQQCCPSDHRNMAGGFCTDCMAFAAVNIPIDDERDNRPISSVEIFVGQSCNVASDAPVPKT